MARLGTETHRGLRQKVLRLESEAKGWWDGVGGQTEKCQAWLATNWSCVWEI